MSPVRSRNLPFIWLIGQQNTGKKTHGDFIKEKFELEHISVTEILRNEAKKDTPRGTFMAEYLQNHRKPSDVIFTAFTLKNI